MVVGLEFEVPVSKYTTHALGKPAYAVADQW